MDVETKYNMKFIWSICLVAAMGGLLFGYDWVVINGAKPFFEKYFNLTTPSQIGWAMSCALVGCLIGSVLSGISSDRFGRKCLLILSAFIFFFSAIGTGLANTFSAFVVFRILGGVAIGLASNLSPMYIAEAAPAKVRGQFVSVNQLTIVIGILAAPFVNWLIAKPVPETTTAVEILSSWNGQYAWRWMFGAAAIPALVFFILMFIVPESPRWLIKNGRDKQAQGVLEKIGGASYAADAVRQVKDTLANEIERVNFKDLLEPKMMKILVIGIFLAVFQQWCGINTVLYYADEIFTAAGYGVSDILFNIVIMGSVFVVFTFVAIYTVDRFGRKILMLVGSAGLAITYVLIGLCYHTHSTGFHVLFLVVTAIACYAFSLAPVVWVLLAEIFPNRIRGAAMSVGVFALWTGCFTLTYTFPALNASLGTAKTFWIYAVICAVGFWFVKIFVPETKGKTLEQIEKELVD